MLQNWEKQEDTFHLQQARLRSSIRIANGRAKPIDLLAVYINPDEENLEIQMHEPYAALVVSEIAINIINKEVFKGIFIKDTQYYIYIYISKCLTF